MIDSKDKERFFSLLDPIHSNLERYALKMTGNRDAAGDIVSDTILIAYDRFNTVKNEKAFLSFLLTIASRLYYDMLRKSKRMETRETNDLDDYKGDRVSPESSTDHSLLNDALAKLPDKYREAVVLFDLLGFSYKEISTIRNIPVTTVRIRIHRGRKKLAALLGAENDLKKGVSAKEVNFNTIPESING